MFKPFVLLKVWFSRRLQFALQKRRGLLLRSALCWALGLFLLIGDETLNYDKRFELRGNQGPAQNIVLITIKQANVASTYFPRTQLNGDYDQITNLTDSFFWSKEVWKQLLTKILVQSPQSVGVTLYFGDNIGDVDLDSNEESLFKDPRIIWSSAANYLEQTALPRFANRDNTNIGSHQITKDEDGTVRRFFNESDAHLSAKLAQKEWPVSTSGIVINYRGSGAVFHHLSASEILFDEIPQDFLKGKIVLIGAETSEGQIFLTPHGPQSRLEIIAHMTDHVAGTRTIRRLPFWFYALLLLGLTILAVHLISNHPQKVVIMFFIWIATLNAALSVWTFDTFYVWTPTITPIGILIFTWIIFVMYQANKIEHMHFQLQQEQRALQELEQLKNNFVSLISHDLKTPIAKIQAIVDRMSLEHSGQSKISTDLKSLRNCSEELNKYIQSILKLLRLESRDFHLNKEVADINEVIEEVMQQISPLAHEKNIRVSSQLEPLFALEFDITLLKEVVLNLVENAIKYTPPGGEVSITSEEIDNVVRVQIADTGEGIKPEDLEKVWGKFTRGSDQDLKSKGTGLGLYLVKYFIELHNGSVHIESQLGAGTQVVFTLPIEQDEPINNVNTETSI